MEQQVQMVDSLIPGSQLSIEDFVGRILVHQPDEIQEKLGQVCVQIVKPQGESVAIESVTSTLFKKASDFQRQLMSLDCYVVKVLPRTLLNTICLMGWKELFIIARRALLYAQNG